MGNVNSKRRLIYGFTLIELLVVFSIVSLLASIILASIKVSKTKASNAALLSQVRQYVDAFEIANSNGNGYPFSGDNGTYCLGHGYANNNCYLSGATYNENPALNAALSPYIPGLPINTQTVPFYSNSNQGIFTDCGSISNGKCNQIDILFTLQGNPVSCGSTYNSVISSDGVNTLCDIKLQNF